MDLRCEYEKGCHYNFTELDRHLKRGLTIFLGISVMICAQDTNFEPEISIFLRLMILRRSRLDGLPAGNPSLKVRDSSWDRNPILG